MTGDARFEDGREAPLRLMAQDADDVPVIAALVQDAVLSAVEMTWDRKGRRFALLLNRFRWEDQSLSEAARRPYERVRSVLAIDDALAVASQGIDRGDRDLVLSLLDIAFEPGEDGTGDIVLTFAGDGAIRASVDCVNLVLRDVTRPYVAPSGKRPDHNG